MPKPKRKPKGKTVWFEIIEGPEPLLRFEKPSAQVFSTIRKILASAPEVGLDSALTIHRREDAVILQNVDEVMRQIAEDLKRDYGTNRIEADEWSGWFDYYIIESVPCPGGYDVCTRLYPHDQRKKLRSITYCRHVRRIDEMLYAYWSSD